MKLTKSERPHIAFFGCTNAGKSSIVNAVTNQKISVVSEVKGTTTDPVQKSMEILPLGPVVIIDTAGFNDDSILGEERIKTTKQILDKTDIAVLVTDSTTGICDSDKELMQIFDEKKIPYIILFNKSDLIKDRQKLEPNSLYTSTINNEGIFELKEKLGHILEENKTEKYILRDYIKSGDKIVLVIPIDESAPKGRIILPQQNVLREILDSHACAFCSQVDELEEIIKIITPNLVITDSQAFNMVKDIVPENIMLTSFSILMANYKGSLKILLKGAEMISELKDNDCVLISEGCTHHRQCNDIGTVKLPKWISEYTNKKLNFEFTQGGEFPENLSKYSLIIHCGGCMLNESEMKNRVKHAKEQEIPIVNYGMAIAYMNGILPRALEIFEFNK